MMSRLHALLVTRDGCVRDTFLKYALRLVEASYLERRVYIGVRADNLYVDEVGEPGNKTPCNIILQSSYSGTLEYRPEGYAALAVALAAAIISAVACRQPVELFVTMDVTNTVYSLTMGSLPAVSVLLAPPGHRMPESIAVSLRVEYRDGKISMELQRVGKSVYHANVYVGDTVRLNTLFNRLANAIIELAKDLPYASIDVSDRRLWETIARNAGSATPLAYIVARVFNTLTPPESREQGSTP